MSKAKVSVTSKVFSALESGKELTAAQIMKMGVSNPHNVIYSLRQRGAPIYSNKRSLKGETVIAYRLGTPRRFA